MQFKIIHNIIATNKRKKDWGINESDKCSFCNNEDTLDHALWECIFTQDVLSKCLSMLNLTIFNISKEQLMLGCDEMAMDNVLLIIKNYLLYVRSNSKQYNKTQFVKELKIRWLSDNKYMGNDRIRWKWSYLNDLKNTEIWQNMLT